MCGKEESDSKISNNDAVMETERVSRTVPVHVSANDCHYEKPRRSSQASSHEYTALEDNVYLEIKDWETLAFQTSRGQNFCL